MLPMSKQAPSYSSNSLRWHESSDASPNAVVVKATSSRSRGARENGEAARDGRYELFGPLSLVIVLAVARISQQPATSSSHKATLGN